MSARVIAADFFTGTWVAGKFIRKQGQTYQGLAS
jgi:hypothetical protein